ncbi:uncharacterized protein [Linepithema humile]|uniref:uncharacterized protein n=1 Tax=Linepithema humile TaxID=83485 RepID=UPI0006237EC6|nr:PREDICTED: uncharacterized protein LOC105677885 [Linepithema humile]
MDIELNQILVRFWETEEVPMKPSFTADKEKCENHFRTTHARRESGRYIVRLPFKQFPPHIGDLRCIATRLYDKLERRLSRDANLAASYNAFLQEYLDLGHMELVTGPESSHDTVVYLPHHPVVKSKSLSTKLRVVFNASCATSNKTSLNDHLHTGSKLQTDLMSILIRWRQHKYVYLADIKKMFRQIMMHPEDADYQRILWRPSSQSSIQSYRLRTVTYGTAPAPYLAIRVLHQLVEDEGHQFPLARSILLHETYVDDILFGAGDIDTANAMRVQLVNMLAAGGFCLRKWAANATEMLEDVPPNDRAINMDHSLEEDNNIKVLGISWLPRNDSFSFHISLLPTAVATKRSILSAIARIFDPLGWATPVVIIAKSLMQELWIRTCGWDEPLPADLSTRWETYRDSLRSLTEVRIPRWTGQSKHVSSIEYYGFSDASLKSISAVVYMRITCSNDVEVMLIAAKSKVAPIKTLSVPRLELNGAVLLVKLLQYVIETMQLSSIPTYCWTDSTIVLKWLKKHPSTWVTFVANRVSKIQTELPSATWCHVPTGSNPADIASRGITPADLSSCKLWWSGPTWLTQSSKLWPRQTPKSFDEITRGVNTETCKAAVAHINDMPQPLALDDLPHRLSSWTRLLRVTAYVLRFIACARSKRSSTAGTDSRLTAAELSEARIDWCKQAQLSLFASEYKKLRRKQPISSRSPLIKLTPFLDENDTIRLGGRLKNAPLAFFERQLFCLVIVSVT